MDEQLENLKSSVRNSTHTNWSGKGAFLLIYSKSSPRLPLRGKEAQTHTCLDRNKELIHKTLSPSKWILLFTETLEVASDATQRLPREGIPRLRLQHLHIETIAWSNSPMPLLSVLYSSLYLKSSKISL